MTATVVTGMGVMAPTGLGTRRFWERTMAGQAAIGRITAFDPEQYSSKLAGEITGFAPGEHLTGRLLPQTDRMTRLALVAADWALQDAAVDAAALPEFGLGVVTASSAGGFEFATASWTSCGAEGRNTSAPTSPSPGSMRSTPARSRSGTGCAVRAGRW